MNEKRAAYEFLEGMEERLTACLPSPDVLRSEVHKRWNTLPRPAESQVGCGENIFLYHFALPEIR